MSSTSKQSSIENLKNRILSMELEPGRVLDETELSSQLGISRTPLREIIQRLAGEGYVVIEKNRGTKVASMDFATMRHFFQAAPMIYASVARLAAEQATAKDMDTLKDIQRLFRQSVKDGRAPDTAMHNHRFHAQIGHMASSPYLTPSLNRLLIDHTRIGQYFYRSSGADDNQRIGKAAHQHDIMIEAFAKHDPVLAVDLTMQHWELSRGQMERFVSPDPLPFDLEGYSDAV